ncbi:uncharacterized protein N7515_001687 [Penicillium bovifimosum]|uniref:Uncharacterized protein n=1 Tax=Penicillium bovifimosum TaxID=126998 RepID=A0A9W9HAP9_9EURO|nr:uncharacterized protein N7515_001687 [Penicillium bovifimosum]KAJ5142900.1 hypothetical protein N7515_001687 [Penicillium bovifimosum]
MRPPRPVVRSEEDGLAASLSAFQVQPDDTLLMMSSRSSTPSQPERPTPPSPQEPVPAVPAPQLYLGVVSALQQPHFKISQSEVQATTMEPEPTPEPIIAPINTPPPPTAFTQEPMQSRVANDGCRPDTSWDTSDIGVFDPDNLSAHAIQDVNGSIVYHDVYVWIDHMRDLVHVKSEQVVRFNMPSCFRGDALPWRDIELTRLEREEVRTLPLEEGWFSLLIQRFKPPRYDARRRLEETTYTWGDVRAGREPRKYAQDLIRYARCAGETDTYTILTRMRKNIDPGLRGNVMFPKPDTTRAQFLQHLDHKFDDWLALIHQRDSKAQARQEQQTQRAQNPWEHQQPRPYGPPLPRNNPEANQQGPQPQYQRPRVPREQYRQMSLLERQDQATPAQARSPATNPRQPRQPIANRPYYQQNDRQIAPQKGHNPKMPWNQHPNDEVYYDLLPADDDSQDDYPEADDDIGNEPVFNDKEIVILSYTMVDVPVRMRQSLPANRKFVFTPTDTRYILSSYIVDDSFTYIPVTNYTDESLTVEQGVCLGDITEATEADCRPVYQL